MANLQNIEWLDPIMIAGHWVPELVRLAGGEPVLAATGGPSRTVDLETLQAAKPDVIVVQPCGFDLEQTRREWRAHPHLAQAFEGWQSISGAPVRLAFADGDAYFNRPGPRLVDSAELLSEIFQTTRGSVYAGSGWHVGGDR
jgi:iron complex transport system substrate-binding protein